MVTRKPVASLNTGNVGRKADPPYPTSPEDKNKTPESSTSVYSTDLAASPAFDLIDMNEARTRQRRASDVSSHGTWDTDDEDKEDDYVEVPKPLKITPSKQNLAEQPSAEKKDEIPAILRPGPMNAPATRPIQPEAVAQVLANPWADQPSQQHQQSSNEAQSNNPYLRPKPRSDSSAALPWSNQSIPEPPLPPPPPSLAHPSPPPPSSFAMPVTPQPPSLAPPPPPLSQTKLADPPIVQAPSEELSRLSVAPSHQSEAISSHASSSQQPVNDIPNIEPQANPTPQQKWGEHVVYPPPPGPPPSSRTAQNPIHQQQPTQQSIMKPDHAPPASVAGRSEHYSIKHINWQDEWTSNNNKSTIRQSPILTQNANGPCPLLALVNALVLTTPTSASTALIETLRTREQISLGLLLDAVFDELTSERRGSATTELPDVGELYAFLLALHTGMNVNPRFIPNEEASQAQIPAERTSFKKAGDFEKTREMKLYATFKVPLIHGWLPQPNSQAEQAMKRCAQSFEDAQNIQFAESELEDKLRSSGLTPDEQQLLQDIHSIKHFLNTWPTQLTDSGLEAISSSLYPGQFAILFRNDHFSTIYKEPKHGALMTLVTDAGYSSHDEIIWESLVDVNGAASEMFSGDFRVVSHSQEARLNQGNSAGGQDGWTTVPERNRPSNPHEHVTTSPRPDAPPLPGPRPPTLANTVGDSVPTHQRSRSEQEDHDLALALQLQEEEEAQQRQTEDRRRREQRMSEQFLSTDVDARPPTIPPRRGGSRQSTSTRPAVNRPSDGTFNPDAPPTYEQSASDRPYREAGSTARPAQSSPLNAYDELRRQQEQQSAYAQQNSNSPTTPVHGGRQSYSRRRPQQAATVQEAEDKCTIM